MFQTEYWCSPTHSCARSTTQWSGFNNDMVQECAELHVRGIASDFSESSLLGAALLHGAVVPFE